MPLPPVITNPAYAAYKQAIQRTDGTSSNGQDSASTSFGDVLAESIGGAIDASVKSENISIQAAAGQGQLQDVVEAVNAAEISLQTVVAIRDRVISAYQEILRMPI